MTPEADVTHWLEQLKGGDRAAAVEVLWRGYFPRLVALARDRLRGAPRRAADEEDVALSAFDSFCRNAEQGRFPCLDDRDDLWQVLVRILVCKAADHANHEARQKRGGGQVVPASVLAETGEAFADLISREPDPALAAQVAEGCQRLLDALDDDVLRQVAVRKMEGETNEEIRQAMGFSLTKVERKLRRIRGILERCLAG